MKKIYKYDLEITDEQFLELPAQAKVLSIGIQNNQLKLWALVNPDNFSTKHRVTIFGTGEPIQEVPIQLLGTVFIRDLAFHVFMD
jgi:hypothetical protein